MDMSFGAIMTGVVFGSLGIGYFIYGKKQADWPFLVAGIALGVFPYFIASLWLLILVGVAISTAPFLLKRWL